MIACVATLIRVASVKIRLANGRIEGRTFYDDYDVQELLAVSRPMAERHARRQMVIALSGPAAEEHFCGRATGYDHGDEREAQLLASIFRRPEEELKTARDAALRIVNGNWPAIGKIAQALAEKLCLSATELRALARTVTPFFLISTRPGLPIPKRKVVAGNWQVDPAKYDSGNDTFTTVFLDLRDGQLGLAGRYRGSVPQGSLTDSKGVARSKIMGIVGAPGPGETGKTEIAKDALEQICRIAGGVLTTSQGRIHYRDLYGTKSAVAFFPETEIAWAATSPGLRARSPRFFVPFQPEKLGGNDWTKAIERDDAEIVTNLEQAGIEAGTKADMLPDEVARWLKVPVPTPLGEKDAQGNPLDPNDEAEGLADAIAHRHVRAFAAGMILWRFQSRIPHPELEIGDMVAVETTRFVARDPIARAALRSQLWARAVVVGKNLWGTDLLVWVRGYADIATSKIDITPRVPRTRVLELGAGTHGELEFFANEFLDPPDIVVTPAIVQEPAAALWSTGKLDASAPQVLEAVGKSVKTDRFEVRARLRQPDQQNVRQHDAPTENSRISSGSTTALDIEPAGAVSDSYTFRYNIQLCFAAGCTSGVQTVEMQLAIEYSTNGGTTWTQAGATIIHTYTCDFTNNPSCPGCDPANGDKEVSRTIAGLGPDTRFRITVLANTCPACGCNNGVNWAQPGLSGSVGPAARYTRSENAYTAATRVLGTVSARIVAAATWQAHGLMIRNVSAIGRLEKTLVGRIFVDDFAAALGDQWYLIHGPWQVAAGVLEITPTTDGHLAMPLALPGLAEHVLQVKAKYQVTGLFLGLMLRYDISNGWLVQYLSGLANPWRLNVLKNGLFTQKAQANVTLDADTFATLKLHVKDATQKLWQDTAFVFNQVNTDLDGRRGVACLRSGWDRVAAGKITFDDLSVYLNNSVVCTGLPTGHKLKVLPAAIEATESGGIATVDLLGNSCPQTTVEVRDAANALVATFTPKDGVWGGDEYKFT